MKKIIFFLGFLSFAIFIQAQTATPPSAGDGTANNPYQISSINNLYWLQQDSNQWSKHYIQISNIDASATQTWNAGKGWIPIGSAVSEIDYHAFQGTYNGKGYTISNLYCNRPNDYLTGIWGLTYGATIDSVGLVNVNIVGNDEANGALISMCANTTVRHCYSTGTVSAVGGVGGLIGNSFWNSYVENCYSTCTVTCSDDKAGGLMGKNESPIYYSYATGNVSGTGLQESNDRIGGLVGNNKSIIKHCYATGNVSGPSRVGGLVGDNTSEDNNNAIIDSCYATGQVSSIGNVDFTCVGGLVGIVQQSAIVRNSYATGNVTTHSNSSQVGGLAGQNNSSSILFCFSTGNVSGGGSTGGLVGQNQGVGEIGASYSRGNVTGVSNNVGGLVGRNTTNIIYCYSTGIAFSNGCYGGILGSNEETGLISKSFWDQTTSALSVGCGYNNGIAFEAWGKPTSEMKTQTTFTNQGWDFIGETAVGTEDIWKITPNINDGYPSLYWQNFEVGINDIVTKLTFNIFPNPASNQVYINLKNYNKETFKLDIYNQLGMNVKTVMINQMSNRINVSELSNGIYFLKIETTNGVSCKKLIIQK